MPRSISIVVPALNEEKNLEAAVAEVHPEIAKHFEDYEVLVVDDGSTDKTGEIADRLARENPKVKAVHNGRNMGLGYSYFRGVDAATKQYVMMVPGDGENSLAGMEAMWPLLGTVDIVVPFTSNPEVRPLSRRLFSRFGTFTMNLLFGLKLKYYNGTVVHRLERLRTIKVENHGFLYQAESLVRLIRNGATYVEVGIAIRSRPSGKSKVTKPKNLWSVAKTLLKLTWQVRVLGRT